MQSIYLFVALQSRLSASFQVINSKHQYGLNYSKQSGQVLVAADFHNIV